MAEKTHSEAVARNSWLFVSGILALDDTGKVDPLDDIVGQTDRIYRRLGQILAAHGCSFDDVVVTRDYVTDATNYPATADVRRR